MSASTASYYNMSSNVYSSHLSKYSMEPTFAQMSTAELDTAALDTFVYNPVTEAMIENLANRTNEVIACDAPASSGKRSSEPAEVDEGPIPTLKEFITRLVVCSNVQVPTLMSSLVYLTRLKARLQPHATGRKSTPHRIFLATLILSAKYLNDSSPKNKHWARYTYVPVMAPVEAGAGIVADFSFRTAEVNEMERQLLSLLCWDLRIEESDLIREFEPFLAPIRRDVADRFARRQRRKYEQAKAAAAAAAELSSSPPSSIYSASTRSGRSDSNASDVSAGSSSSNASARSRSVSPYPPSLTYSQSPSSSRGGSSPSHSSRATTPEDQASYVYCGAEEAAADSPSYQQKAAPAEKPRPHIFNRLAAAFQSR
ncbi:hypothetical protein RB595_003559 [Gaeumannomyces hyphopodioides]